MTQYDLSLALTAHSETIVAGPTMRSAEAAIAAAEAKGYQIERLIGFDTPKPETVTYFTQPHFTRWQTHHFAFKDQGLTRNALAEVASGRYLAFLDADDLFSENWLLRACEQLDDAAKAGRKVIIHPELNWQFDAIQNVYSNPAQDDPFFSPYVMSTANYYDAMCVAPRDAWIEHGFPKRDIASGFAMEDYQWFVEMTANGWVHEVAQDTIIFKRRRDVSQSAEARGSLALIRAVDALRIDRVGKMTENT
ncbi:MAG: glycosyltransferase family A protein [Pseudomonadota bacterium]